MFRGAGVAVAVVNCLDRLTSAATRSSLPLDHNLAAAATLWVQLHQDHG